MSSIAAEPRPLCFVIQPFDSGRYDRRYFETFMHAIQDAGLEPYRVDQDPTTSIPIERIEQGIRDAAVCFAEITEDNPNVWYELGYAIASNKEVVMASTEERPKFPFDIQHRYVVRYKTESKGDYDQLQAELTRRLRAALERGRNVERIENLAPTVAATRGLSPHELTFLAFVAERMDSPTDEVSAAVVRRDMQNAGFNDLAATLSYRSLTAKGYLEIGEGRDYDNEPFVTYRVLDNGFDWLESNQERLVLRTDAIAPLDATQTMAPDDDLDSLPF